MNETDAKVSAAAAAGHFNPEQKRYLEGFVAGAQIARAAKGLGGATGGGAVASEPVGPDAAGLKAQNRLIASGGKLSDQEKFKCDQHPFDTYGRLKDHAAKGEYPKPADNFRGASSACFTWRRTRTPICAGCASRTGYSMPHSSRA